MYDAGTRQLVQLGDKMQQGVLQGPVRISGGGMDHEPRRLVHDEKMVVLEPNVQRNILGDALVTGLRHQGDANLFSTLHFVTASATGSVHQYAPIVDPLLEPAAGKLGKCLGKDLIESPPCHGMGDPQETLARRSFVSAAQNKAPKRGPKTAPAVSHGLLYTSVVFLWANCRMFWIRTTLICSLALVLSACAWLESAKDQTKDWSASKLYTEAAQELDSGNYKTAIEYYEKLEARYPFGRYAMQAQLDVAYAHYKGEEPEAAIAAADRFIKLYPQNPYVDYAYYLKGIINYNRSVGFLDRYIPTDPSQRDPGSALDAFQDFAELVRLFPDSKYAADARQRMIYLRNNLAKNEVHVARYYMKRQAYVAAANRCTYVVEHYQRTSAVENALEVLIEAYKNLGEDKLAADAERVLTLNRQAGRFINDEPAPGEVSLSRKLWDHIGLDTN